MKEYKASTRKGMELIEKARYFEGFNLDSIYGSYSLAKQNAFEWCWNEFLNTVDGTNFHICSKNTFGFTCSWYGKLNGENILRYETKDNSYIVWLDR